MRGHYIVCGLGIVGYRAAELLHRLGERVVVVTLSGHDERIQAARPAGVEVEIADARDPSVLLRLGVMGARALVVTTSKDVVNVEIALDAQRLRARQHRVEEFQVAITLVADAALPARFLTFGVG